MSANVFTIENYESKIIPLCNEKIENKDYLGALSLLFKILEKDSHNTDIMSKIADVYIKMDLYKYALKYRFKAMYFLPKKDRLKVLLDICTDSATYSDHKMTQHYFIKIVQDYGQEAILSLDENTANKIFSFQTKTGYFQAHPVTEKSSVKLLQNAKKQYNFGMFLGAKSIYESVPAEYLSEEDIRTYFECCDELNLLEDCKKVIKAILQIKGKSLLVCSLLSIINYENENVDKARYFYEEALKLYDGKKENALSLYYAGVNFSDHSTLNKVLFELLKYYPYDDIFNAKYAISCYNLGKFEDGYNTIKKLKRILPFTTQFDGYLYILSKAMSGEKGLPRTISYEHETEEYYLNEARKTLLNSINSTYNISKTKNKLSNISFSQKALYELSIKYFDDVFSRQTVFFLLNEKKKWATELVDDFLSDPNISGEIKRQIIYTKIRLGYLGVLRVVDEDVLYEIRPEKMPKDIFENNLFMCSYSLCISKIFTIENFDVKAIKKATIKVYKALKNEFNKDKDFNFISCLITVLSCPDFNVKALCKFYEIDEGLVNKYLKIINEKVQKNDKNS